ncbi:MAG: OmpA family protein [Verrucomicrobiales bacterium]|nr:OmpA family protein [Verrucomicrobiales bacterium]
MPEKDLAAALAAVEIEETEETPEVKTSDANPLREDDRLSAFYEALDGEDFLASSDELVRLSPELEPELVEQLTMEVEKAVASMGTEEADPVVRLELTPLKVGSDPEKPTVAAAPAKAPSSPVDPTSVVTFFSLVQSGDFASAEAEIARLGEVADPATITSMKAALSSAKAKEEALAASRTELKESQEEMARLQKESVTQIQESVKQLAEVTKAAQKATAEANKLKTELASAETAVPEPDPAPKKTTPKPVTLPETKSVAFGFDSTFLNDTSKEILSNEVVNKLKEEDGLQVQLRGHADTVGPSDYNGILARARCEIVKDYLLEQNVSSSRISIVSFGETQAAATGGTAEELRRVDIIFRAN